MKRSGIACASRRVALCGVLGALSLALMLLGAVIPLAMFIAPAAAGILVMLASAECGPRMAATMYAAVSLLALLFVPDREVALVYLFWLGYYPLLKPRFDRVHPAVLRVSAKLLCFNAAILAMYSLVFLLFPAGQISSDLLAAGAAFTALTLLIGNIAFVIYDKALVSLRKAYLLVWRPKLRHMRGA